MQDIAYYNGRIAPIDEMTIPMNERSSFLGDGVYDAAGVLEHIPLDLEEHIDRLYRSAEKVRIAIPMTKAEMANLLRELVRQVDSPCQFLYVQVTRGVGPRNHLFRYAGEKASVWAFSRPHTFSDVYSSFQAITVEDTRFYHCDVKTIDLLPSVLAAQQAAEAGCQEAIFHRGDQVTECAHSNVHILKDGCFITAPESNLILSGITRAHLLNICRRQGIPVQERPFTLQEMMDADEIFFSASDSFTCRLDRIDSQSVGGKDPHTFGIIRDTYQQEVREQLERAQASHS